MPELGQPCVMGLCDVSSPLAGLLSDDWRFLLALLGQPNPNGRRMLSKFGLDNISSTYVFYEC